MEEAGYLVVHEVAADQALSEPLLEGLVDQASGPGEVFFAALEEVPEAELLGRCLVTLKCVPHPDDRVGTRLGCTSPRLGQLDVAITLRGRRALVTGHVVTRDRQQLLAAVVGEHLPGYEIDNDAAALVAARCDFSALLAKSEAEKLMTFAGTTRRIMADDVEACLIDQQTAGLSEIIDNALNGEGRKALVAFDRFMAEEQNIVPILVVLSSTLLRMHALRTAMDAGTPLMQAIKELRPPVFFKQQDTLAGQVRRWPADALTAYLRLLNTTLRETRLKPSLAEDLTEEIVLKIAKTARGLRSS